MTLPRSTGLFFVLALVLHCRAIGQDVEPQKLSIGDGVELHVVSHGDGEPIVFIHGLLDEASVWIHQQRAFAQEGYRAIAYSRRHNYPNKNAIRLSHSASLEADDLAALIRSLKLEKVHLVGHSYGAYTALLFALKYSDLASTVTLAEAPIVPWLVDLPADSRESGAAQFAKIMNQGVAPAMAAIKSGEELVAIESMFDAIGGKGKFASLPPFVKQKCRRNVLELKAFIASEDRYPDVNRDQVRTLETPTLILSGSESVATAKFTDPELERLIPKQSRKRVILEGASHIMWIERPVQSRQAVLDFIRGNHHRPRSR